MQPCRLHGRLTVVYHMVVRVFWGAGRGEWVPDWQSSRNSQKWESAIDPPYSRATMIVLPRRVVSVPVTLTGVRNMPKNLSPAAVAKKWADRTKANVQTYVDGINAVTESPTEKAAAAVDRYASGVAEAASSGKFAASLNSVSLDTWKRKAANKGKANMTAGVNEAEQDVAKVMQTLIPHTQMVSQTVKGMPKGTIQDSIARATKSIEMMAQYKRPQ